MASDQRDVLEVLKFELEFLEQGGYGRSVRTPWKPTSVFQDSLTCINFDDPKRTHPCNECLLHAFVPETRKDEDVPCHHIPLNARGETIHSMERQASQVEMEETLKAWLRRQIERLEQERAGKADQPAQS
jgi:hypothetical protein